MLLSDGAYSETYDENGECIDSNHYSCDEDEWLELIGKYVPAEIFEAEVESETQETQNDQV